MVQPQYSPQEALNKIKLMMNYDMSKTLNENKDIIFEQSLSNPKETSAIAYKIYKQFMGDVQSSDLQNVQDILTDEVFGKSYEDGSCLLNKVTSYIKSIKGGNLSDYFTTLQSITADDTRNKTLMQLISMSTEENEPEFNDIKRKLITSINGEINGFCKTKKVAQPPVTPPKTEKPKTPGKSAYKPCSGTYSYGCKSDVIAKVQGCLGLTPDGKFGKKTKAALASKGVTSFTDADVTKICSSNQPVKPEVNTNIEDVDGEDPNKI